MGHFKKGFNDLETWCKENNKEYLLEEWDYEKNAADPDCIDLPCDISKGSHKSAWWKCPVCEKSYSRALYLRTNLKHPQSCSCNRYERAAKTNIVNSSKGKSFAKAHPELVEEWLVEKNGELTPDTVSEKSSQRVWWKCKKCGGEWDAVVEKRSSGQGCPYCSGHRVLKGYNDLATINPFLATEWDYEKNKYSPDEVTANNNKKVFWKCSICGYEWTAPISNRSAGSGCRRCSRALQTSLPEQLIYYYIKETFTDVINQYHADWLSNNQSLDIYIPDYRIAIEYDGVQWHKNKIEKDNNKNILCEENGVTLIRFRENGLSTKLDKCIVISLAKADNNYVYLQNGLEELAKHIKSLTGVNCKKDFCIKENIFNVLALISEQKKEKSLAHLHPELLKEWDYEKNNPLSPEQITTGVDLKVWWKCSVCGYEWEASVGDRTNGHGCSYCGGRVLWVGHNDLETWCKENNRQHLLKEWNYEKNRNDKKCVDFPSQVTAHSNDRVWWKCDICKQTYPCRISDKVNHNVGCSVCDGKYVVKGYNDLATTNKELIKEWHPTKNGDKTPFDFTAGSNKKVWWKCSKCGYEWEIDICSRAKMGKGCKKCGSKNSAIKRKQQAAQNMSFAKKHPELVSEWHPTKNGDLTPDMVSYGSKDIVWWICPICGKDYQAAINNRHNGSGCKYWRTHKKVKKNDKQ